MRVAFTGSHSVGKTTLATMLGELIEEKIPQSSTYIIGSTTRSVLSWGGNTGGRNLPIISPEENGFQLACIYERRRLMLNKKLGLFSDIISERWALDEAAYQSYKASIEKGNSFSLEAQYILEACKLEMKWELENYWDRIYYIPVDEREVEDDGVRPLAKQYQIDIDEYINKLLIPYRDKYIIKEVPKKLGEIREFFLEELEEWKSIQSK